MLWLILLAVAVCLLIALRRVLRRQSPLDDELYSKSVAVDHVHSGVAWVRTDGTFGSVNQSFAATFNMQPKDFAGQEWYKAFSKKDHARVRESYSEMMLMGMTTLEAAGERKDGSTTWLNVRLLAVHDGHMRLVGHHCMIEDKTRERELEQQVRTLEARAAHVHGDEPDQTVADSLEPTTRAIGRSVINVLDRARKTTREPVSPISAAS
jgi:PAS domain S-box-containing protein